MDRFKILFGIDKKDIQRHCVVVPFLAPQVMDHLGIRGLAKGFLCSSGQTKNLTFIKTQMGALFVGDAVLQLEDTACENIIFFGSCGLINRNLGLDIGSLVLPTSAYAIESFSDLAAGREPQIHPAYPHADLLQNLSAHDKKITPVSCVSFGSLELEEHYLPLFMKLGADVIEMECAALFNATQRINKKAMALLFISDILGNKLFWEERSAKDKKRLAIGISQACQAIKQYAIKY